MTSVAFPLIGKVIQDLFLSCSKNKVDDRSLTSRHVVEDGKFGTFNQK